MPNNRVALHHCHSVVVVGIVGLAAAIQHFTNGSFPYVCIDVVAANAGLLLSSVHHKYGARESTSLQYVLLFLRHTRVNFPRVKFSDRHRLSENLTCEPLAQYKGVDLSQFLALRKFPAIRYKRSTHNTLNRAAIFRGSFS